MFDKDSGSPATGQAGGGETECVVRCEFTVAWPFSLLKACLAAAQVIWSWITGKCFVVTQ